MLFHVSRNKKDAEEILSKGKVILYATSYGKAETLIDPYPFEGSSRMFDGNLEGGKNGT